MRKVGRRDREDRPQPLITLHRTKDLLGERFHLRNRLTNARFAKRAYRRRLKKTEGSRDLFRRCRILVVDAGAHIRFDQQRAGSRTERLQNNAFEFGEQRVGQIRVAFFNQAILEQAIQDFTRARLTQTAALRDLPDRVFAVHPRQHAPLIRFQADFAAGRRRVRHKAQDGR